MMDSVRKRAVSGRPSHWFRIDTEFDGQIMTARLTPDTDSVYFAYFEPYSYERHLDLIGSAALSPHVQLQRLGATLEGRDMMLLRITDALGTPIAAAKPVRTAAAPSASWLSPVPSS